MRKLNVDDSFALSEILDKLDIDDEIDKISEKGKKLGLEWTVAKLLYVLAKKMYKARTEVINLLASVNDKDPEELRKLPIETLVKMLKELLDDPEFTRLFHLPEPSGQE